MDSAKIETTVGELVSAVFEAAKETAQCSKEASELTKMIVDDLIARAKAEAVSH